MDTNQSLKLSVVLMAHDAAPGLLALIEQLRTQSRAGSLELVIVTPSAKKLSLDRGIGDAFFSFQIIKVSDLKSVGQVKAEGVRAARAPLVAFLEDHSRVEPGWAEALIEAHAQGEFSVVGPVMTNANPTSAVSWGGFLVFYGPWMEHRAAETVRHLPGNQSCYRREILMAYGEHLADVLESESLMHWELVAQGHRLHLEPKAVVGHINPTRLRSLLEEHYVSSRIFSYMRTRRQSALKRLFYAIGSPMIPLIRLRRIIQETKATKLGRGVVLRALLPIIFNLCAGAAGEMAGYMLGAGRSRQRLLVFEAVRDFSSNHQVVARKKTHENGAR